MTKEFEQYINNTRNEFVEGVNKLQWDTEFRTKCENLLIAFDQMKAALRQPAVISQFCECIKEDWDGADVNGNCVHCGKKHK